MMDFRKARAPEVTPFSIEMGRRWRWDRFLSPGEALDWYNLRKAEGHAVYLRGKSVAWDQDTAPAAKRRTYPKTRLDWCNHCGERRTYVRTGTGKKDSRPAYRKAGFRDYHYTEPEPHTCPGLEKERRDMAASQARMSKMLGRLLRS